ncbi:MAG: hypothetical protein WAN12_18845 [Candidatus Acidiferrum sp.]
MRKTKQEDGLGQRLCATVLSHQLGISTERAMKLYVRGKEIAPEWEQLGKGLLGNLDALLTAARIDPESKPS